MFRNEAKKKNLFPGFFLASFEISPSDCNSSRYLWPAKTLHVPSAPFGSFRRCKSFPNSEIFERLFPNNTSAVAHMRQHGSSVTHFLLNSVMENGTEARILTTGAGATVVLPPRLSVCPGTPVFSLFYHNNACAN